MELNTLHIGIFIGGFSLSMLCILAIIEYRRAKLKLTQQFKDKFLALDDLAKDYDRRLQILEKHASDYALSLDPGRLVELQDARTLLNLLDTLLEDVDQLLSRGDYKIVEEIERFLTSKIKDLSEVIPEDAKTRIIELQNWDGKLEGFMQALGKEIAQASVQFHELGLHRGRERINTTASLYDAKISLDLKRLRKDFGE